MPFHKARYDRTLIWRPRGTPYAEGESEDLGVLSTGTAFTALVMAWKVASAFKAAVSAFYREFGFLPNHDKMVVEIVASRDKYRATVFDLTR